MIGGGARVFVGGPEQDVAMTVTARLDLAIFDAADIDKVGSFYAELTGWDVARKDSDRFGLRTPDGQEIEFQRAPDHVAPQWPGQEHPQQFHLDLQIDDHQAAAESGPSGWVPPGWPTARPGSRLRTPPVTRSICARPKASAR
jgi:hypothetical protein